MIVRVSNRSFGVDAVTYNVLAILDLRLQRLLDVVVPMPSASNKNMHIGFDADDRLCAFCLTPRHVRRPR